MANTEYEIWETADYDLDKDLKKEYPYEILKVSEGESEAICLCPSLEIARRIADVLADAWLEE